MINQPTHTVLSLQGIPIFSSGAKPAKPTLKAIVAISEGKKNLLWFCRTEQQSAKRKG